MNTLTIRKAVPADLPELNRILRASKAHWRCSKEYLDEFMEKLCVTENCVRSFQIFCVYMGGQLVGFYGFRKNENHKDELDFLFLDAPYIGNGLDRLIWNSCLETVKKLGITEFFLNAEPNSETFYLKMGCQRIGSKTSVISSETHLIPILFYGRI